MSHPVDQLTSSAIHRLYSEAFLPENQTYPAPNTGEVLVKAIKAFDRSTPGNFSSLLIELGREGLTITSSLQALVGSQAVSSDRREK